MTNIKQHSSFSNSQQFFNVKGYFRQFRRLVLSLLCGGLLLSGNAAKAAMNITFSQVGADVVATYSGSWNSWTSSFALDLTGNRITDLGFFANNATVDSGWSGANTTKVTGAWTTLTTDADSFSGDAFGFSTQNPGFLYARNGYIAGESIEGSMTFNNTDIVTLGFTPGDFGSFSSDGGTISYSVAVPEPSSVALLTGFLASIFVVLRRRCRAA